MSRKFVSNWSSEEVSHLVFTHFGKRGTAHPLHGERDHNFRLVTDTGEFVLKLSPPEDDAGLLDFRTRALRYLEKIDPGLTVPRVIPGANGEAIVSLETAGGSRRTHAHLLSWLPGTLMVDFKPGTTLLSRDLGSFLGRLDQGLKEFSHPSMQRELAWDMAQAATLKEHLEAVPDPELRSRLSRVLESCVNHVLPALSSAPCQVIHNDANDHNLLVDRSDPWNPRVSGILDFGDMVYSRRVFEPAIAAAYACLKGDDPVAMVANLIAGYHEVMPLEEVEINHVFDLVLLRLATSLLMAHARSISEPDNPYLQISQTPVLRAFLRLFPGRPALARARIRHACGLPGLPGALEVQRWLLSQRGKFAPVVSGLKDDEIHVLDLSVGGRDASVSRGASGWRVPTGKIPVVGRYNEARLCYTTSQFREENGSRTIHLGIDLFAPAGEPVHAPMDGQVVSVADNNMPGDYGPTVILEHRPEDGPLFYSLYGHLRRASVSGLKAGDEVKKGDLLARMGSAEENGGWEPHLHFQVMADLLDWEGNFPGVARPEDRELWLGICPDPNTILDIPNRHFPPPPRSEKKILEERRQFVNPTLSVSYRNPLTIVRGFMQHLYDVNGRIFLDAVNNVPHVGHCHPRVVDAVATQAAILNTNTRYLHEFLVEYAERLTATLPDPLQVCFFCNSGSEANDLALRLARRATGRRDIMVLDAAYHGNLAGLIHISPYKFAGSGGDGCPPGTHVLPLPDPFRGPWRGRSNCGSLHADEVREMIRGLEAAGTPPAAFMAESLPGCGGQIVFPDGYLSEAHAAARACGALTIADEVQVGFGRVGDAFWGFQTQGVIPDIVTMGKPMGNGHPLAAVITTREVADAFVTGMEYFNTFGGNPVSCAAGMAVLDVIEAEGLQEHAREVGSLLLTGLRELATRHPLVGEARGLGLYVGVELIRDRETLDPADWESAYIAERMREEGILISVDGPRHNVLKIKPPLCFNKSDSHRLVETLDIVFADTALQG